MVMLAIIGLFFCGVAGIINAIQLKKFFVALNKLNQRTRTVGDRIMYIFRFICILPLAAPIIPDIVLMAAGGAVGLGGGVLGFIIGTGGTCMVTIIIKIAMKMTGTGTKGRMSKDELRQFGH